jgi:basic membrane protein A
MTKKFYVMMSLLVLFSLVLAACGPTAPTEEPVVPTEALPTAVPAEPTQAPPPEPEVAVKACQVTDVGGIDDKSFNATAWLGMQNASKDFGVEVKYLESQQQSDYEVNINAFIEDGCDVIIAVGFLLADAASAAADANPEQKFGIVDVDYLAQSNVRGNAAAINQGTFLAGYLAAGMTKTGKVGTYVGILFPATQAFMDGYAMGVAKYNEVHGTAVEVLGWDMETQTGLEVGNFESLDDGRALGEQLLDEGADIIMPVAGPVGLGTLAVMQERGTGMLIGVDNDWSVANPDKADFVLASALKKIDVFVYDTVKQVVDGAFVGGEAYLLTLENEGVGLAYGATMGEQVPAELKAEIEALIPQIVSGEVPTVPAR